VRKQVLRTLRVIVVAAEANVALLVEVDFERVPRRNDDPDADVELAIHYQHWVLYVLLNHPSLFCVHIVVVAGRLHVVHVVLRVRACWVALGGETRGSTQLLLRVNLGIL